MFDTVMEDEVKGVRVGGVESTTTDYGMVGQRRTKARVGDEAAHVGVGEVDIEVVGENVRVEEGGKVVDVDVAAGAGIIS